MARSWRPARPGVSWATAVAVVVVAAAVPTVSVVLTTAATGSCLVAAAGDIAEEGGDQQQTADVVQSLNPVAVLTLGDNAYPDGSAHDFATYYDPTWGRFKAVTKPAVGNHEYDTPGAKGYFDYFGVPPYYSYDLCGWHLYSLNREISGSDRDAELAWLRADLAAHAGRPMLAVWHEPRWSSGTTHGSDSGAADLWGAVVAGGVRVVLSGHEHLYERFAELDADGHPHPGGTREFVVGEGGAGLYPFGGPQEGSERRVQGQHGVIALTLRPDGYDWRLVQVGGTVADEGSQQLAAGAAAGSAPGAGSTMPASTVLTPAPSEGALPTTSEGAPPAPSEGAPPTTSEGAPPATSRAAEPSSRGVPSATAPPPSVSAPAAGGSSLSYWWLRASQAAYVEDTQPDHNFGSGPDLLIDAVAPARPLAFLRFDLSAVPAGASVARGRLYLRATSDLAQPVDVYTAPSTWSQQTLTWTNRPLFWPHWVGRIPAARAGDWVSLDVSRVLRAGSPVSLALTTRRPGLAVGRFASDETATPPTLYLALAGTPTR
jgi:acid phosphatase type 7